MRLDSLSIGQAKRIRPQWWLGLIVIAMAHAAVARAAQEADPGFQAVTSPSFTANQTGPALYLDVVLNGQPTQNIVLFYQIQQRFFVSPDDLPQLGLKVDTLRDLIATKRVHVDDGYLIGLDQIPGLHYNYHADKQSLDLMADERLVPPNLIGERVANLAPAMADTGLVFNYDAFVQGGRGLPTTLNALNEQRLFSPWGLFDNTGVARAGGGLNTYTRLDSNWHQDNPQELTTVIVGDAISSSLNWSRAVRFGGFQFKRNFSLRPDLITFPMPSINGSAAVPSSVDLYINNVRQFSSQVPSGPFVINNPVALSGGGQATLVVRDELGREVSTTLPLYVDSRLMARGLDSYSGEAGFLRLNYGSNSFDYRNSPVLSGSYRYGVSDAFTVESHGEATAGLYNAGVGGLLALGQWGVLNASVAQSVGRVEGTQLNAGYQLISSRFSFIAQTTRNFNQYRDLASIGGTPPARVFDQLNFSVPIYHTQSVGLSYIHIRNNDSPIPSGNGVSRIATLSYTAQITRWCSVFGNANQSFDSSKTRGIWLGFSFDFGNRTVGFINGGRNQGQDNYGASMQHAADYSGGLGWGLQDNENGSQGYSRLARADFLGRYGQVGAAVRDDNGLKVLSAEAAGGVVFMDSTFALSRRIYDSFALVSTDGVAGIPVLNANRVIGNTDSSGHLLIPDLNSYQHNHLGIDTMVLPADINIPVSSVDIAPRGQSGVLAHFVVQRYTAATVILVDQHGKPLPDGTMLKHSESGQDFVVGYDGQAFIENLKARNHLVASGKKLSCHAEFNYHRVDDGSLPTIGPILCRATGDHAL